MIKINSISATKTIIEECDQADLGLLRKELTYSDTSVAFNLKKLKENKWLQQNHPDTFKARLSELQAKLTSCMLKYDQGLGKYWFHKGSIPHLAGKFDFKETNHLAYPEGRKIPWRKPLPFDLYPYQDESVKRLIGAKHGCVSLATGMGKTAIILTLARELGLKTIVVTPSKSIFLEILEKFEHHFGKSNVGAYGGGKKRIGKMFTVCISKSLTTLKPGTEEFNFFTNADVVIGDECFPYDTKIQTKNGMIRIGSIVNSFLKNKKTPEVLSFNEATNKFEYKKILNAWKRDLKQLVQVKCGNSSFRCTDNHKILLKNKGWTKAKDIKRGDLIISKPNNKKSCFSFRIPNKELEDLIIGSFLGDGSISYSKNNMPRLRINHGIKQKDYALWKLNLMEEIKGSSWIIEKNGYSQKPAIQTTSKCFYYEKRFPNNKKTCPDFVVNKLNLRSLAIWFMDDGSVCKYDNGNVSSATIHTESFCCESIDKLIDKLHLFGIQCKRVKTKKGSVIKLGVKGAGELLRLIAPFCHKNISYKLAQYSSKVGEASWNTGCLDYSYSIVTDKQSVSNQFQKKYKQFLFDIEVEDNHNFIVGNQGFIAHNCHTLAANTLEKVFHGVLEKVPYRFFLSGTIIRGDGKDKLLHSIVGKEVVNKDTKFAIDGGYICPVNFTVIETKTDDINYYNDPLKAKRKHLLYNENIANIIAKIANGAWNSAQESTLVLVEELSQIKMLADKLTVPYEYVHSASKADAAKHGLEKRKVDQAVEVFNKGKARVLIGTSCIATGTNLYPTHNVFNWVGGSSEVKTKQGAVGRSVRLLEKSEYKDLHKQKPISKIYDFRLTNVPKRRANDSHPDILERHLQKRISMYKETNKDIRFIRVG